MTEVNLEKISAREIYTALIRMPKRKHEELQGILNIHPLTKPFEKYRLHELDDMD